MRTSKRMPERRTIEWFMGRPRLVSAIALAIALVLTLASTLISLHIASELKEKAALVEHTNSVLLTNASLLCALDDAETGQRGYLLTGEAPYLEPYRRGTVEASRQVRRLSDLLSDNPDQAAEGAEVRRLVDNKLAELASTIHTYDKEGPSAAVAVVRGGVGRATMDKLRASLRQVEEEEQITLRERTGELASTARLQVIAISIRGVMIAVIFVGFWALSRELLRAAARAAAAARMAELGSLATGLGHDLANLFMPLRAHSDALAASPSLSEEDRGSVKAIGSVVAYLSDLSRGLRMVARNPDTKGSGAHTQLSVWCKGACAVFKSAVPGTIALNCRTEDGLPEVDIEPHRLTQAVLNLVNNARNAIVGARGDRPQGRIEVLARRGPEQGVVLITVRDDGPGMSREARSRWGRGGFSTTPGGTGLGLAMVQSIVREAGGSIQIESREDQGTAVTLSVPAVVGQ